MNLRTMSESHIIIKKTPLFKHKTLGYEWGEKQILA